MGTTGTAGAAQASQLPVGSTAINTTYSINNDYLYPRYVAPPMLDGLFQNSTWWTRLWGTGLVRGWIYPCDIDPELITAAAATDPSTAASTVVSARMALEQGTTTTTTTDANPQGHFAVGPGATLQTGEKKTKPKRIRFSQGKQFQFNPFSASLTIDFQHASAPAETLQTNGTASESQVGTATTGIEMFFDRSMEVAAATAGVKKVDGHTIDPIFADVGVQKDLWDVYRVILGGDQDYFAKIGSTLVNIDTVYGMKVQPGSITDMTGRLFDLGAQGISAWGRGVAVYYNPNMVFIGWVSSMAFTYAEFNANYIPTKAKMDMGLQVLYSTSESGGDAFVNSTDTTTDPTVVATTVQNPDGTTTHTQTNPATFTASDYNPPTRTTPAGTHYTV